MGTQDERRSVAIGDISEAVNRYQEEFLASLSDTAMSSRFVDPVAFQRQRLRVGEIVALLGPAPYRATGSEPATSRPDATSSARMS